MNDNQQQNNQNLSAFGGALPFTNIPKPKADDNNVSYASSPESGDRIVVEKAESSKAAESAPEINKIAENQPEKPADIERKDQKQFYPQNVQQPQKQTQSTPPAVQAKPQQPSPKFFGYMVSPQIANNYQVISALKGKGDINKSRTWIYILLDRILKKQTYIKKRSI